MALIDSILLKSIVPGCRTRAVGTLLCVSENWTDAQLSRKSMELLAEKVMPAVNKAIGKPAHAKAESVTA